MTISRASDRTDATAGERAIEKITCPFERVKAINFIARTAGTLKGRLPMLRVAALHEARKLTTTVTELAVRVDMTRPRVSTLLNAPHLSATDTGR